MKILTFLFAICFSSLLLQAQEQDDKYVYQTFKDTRVINVHSVETLPAHRLDVRISHRFGDLAGENGGWATFFGLETASDVLIGAEYGFSDNFTAGLYRSKGAGTTPEGNAGLRQLVNGIFKYRLLRQSKDGRTPLSATAVGVTSMSTAKRIEGNEDLIRSFPKFAHRFAFNAELILARKFSDGFSLQVIPAYTHRNLVPFAGRNGLFSLGVAGRLQINRVFGIITDITLPFAESHTTDNGYYPALGIGLEIETGGHVFQVNLTNATAIMETDYIPYTISNWLDGEFRLGFTVSRWFNL